MKSAFMANRSGRAPIRFVLALGAMFAFSSPACLASVITIGFSGTTTDAYDGLHLFGGTNSQPDLGPQAVTFSLTYDPTLLGSVTYINNNPNWFYLSGGDVSLSVTINGSTFTSELLTSVIENRDGYRLYFDSGGIENTYPSMQFSFVDQDSSSALLSAVQDGSIASSQTLQQPVSHIGINDPAGNCCAFDGFSIANQQVTTPEPSTWTLFALAIAALFLVRRIPGVRTSRAPRI